KVSVLFGKRKVSLELRRIVVRAQAKVGVDRLRVNLLPRIHLPIRVPYALELAEGFHQLRAVHADQELASSLAITVLAGKRTAKPHHQIGRLLDKRTEILDARFADQIKINAHVHARLAKMSVERALIAVFAQQSPQLAQVGS